jgi:hypothetical protein
VTAGNLALSGLAVTTIPLDHVAMPTDHQSLHMAIKQNLSRVTNHCQRTCKFLEGMGYSDPVICHHSRRQGCSWYKLHLKSQESPSLLLRAARGSGTGTLQETLRALFVINLSRMLVGVRAKLHRKTLLVFIFISAYNSINQKKLNRNLY